MDRVDLHWIVHDLQGQTSEIWWDSAFQIIDGSASWYGVHVSNVDLEPWQGFSPPIHGLDGWIRGQSHVLTACVVDVDHDNQTETPIIRVDGIDLVTPIQSSSSGSKTCYQSTWIPEIGGTLEPVSIVLFADGVEWSNRSLTPTDLPPQAELTISGKDHLDGARDIVLIELLDPDDPDTLYELNSTILWPGAGLQIIEGDTLIAPKGLEVGDAQISTRIENGKWDGMEWSWSRPVFLTPPTVSAPVLCDANLLQQQFSRGTSGTVWIGVVDARPIDNIGIKVTADANTDRMVPSVFYEELMPPSECTPGTGLESQFFRIQIEESILRQFPLGSVELSVFVRDIDAITGISPTLEFEIVGSKPTLDFSAMPIQFTSGNESRLAVQIKDLDGIQNMECSILLKDQDDITLYSQLFMPMLDGLWKLDWTPPGVDAANHTLYFACLDETSLSVTESMIIQAEAGVMENLDQQNTTQQGSNEESFTIIIGGAFFGFIAILILTLLLYSRGKEELIEEEEQLPDEAWSNQNRDDSDERLNEMAGITESEAKVWTDEELLDAGWTREQVNHYRENQEKNTHSEDEILNIFEEE